MTEPGRDLDGELARLRLERDVLKQRLAEYETAMAARSTRWLYRCLRRARTQVASARALTYQVAARIRDGQPVMVEAAMAKNHAALVAREVCWEAVQIFGGMGYMRETVVERLARDARLLPIGGGTQEIMNELIARFGLGL